MLSSEDFVTEVRMCRCQRAGSTTPGSDCTVSYWSLSTPMAHSWPRRPPESAGGRLEDSEAGLARGGEHHVRPRPVHGGGGALSCWLVDEPVQVRRDAQVVDQDVDARVDCAGASHVARLEATDHLALDAPDEPDRAAATRQGSSGPGQV